MKPFVDSGRMVDSCDSRNPSTVGNAILLSTYLHIVIFLVQFSAGAAEEDVGETNDASDDDIVSKKEYEDDSWFMLLLMSLLFGFFITLFGAWVGYFSTLEDKLMRRYWMEGETIVARVISSDFARGGGSTTTNVCIAANNDTTSDRFHRSVANPEYVCFCEYDRNLAHNYIVRVRKQCKAKAWDFVLTPRPGSERMLLSIKRETSQRVDENGDEIMFVELPDQPEACCAGADDNGADANTDVHGGRAVPPDRKFLEMLILPGHELSALPKKAVQRACSIQYRFSTAGLVLFGLCLALCCTYWAIHEVTSLEDDSQRARGWCAIVAFVVLAALEIPLIHGCCHGMLVDALKEEYLDSGDFVPMEDDASSLSSGSDMYLASQSRSSFLL
jgi:hypothetical protein